MKAFNKIFVAVIAMIILIFAVFNLLFASSDNTDSGRPYRVEINRLVFEIEQSGFDSVDMSGCEYVTHIEKYRDKFYDSDSDYTIREINGVLYRFDYTTDMESDKSSVMLMVNIILGILSAMIIGVLIFIRIKILLPFENLTNVPYELSKGNLTCPIKEDKSRFFGRFIWGVDLLRENMEQQKQRELDLQRDKKMLLLSLSHDIKTPLSAIKLYSKALSKGLYDGREKQIEIAESINTKADEIESYVLQIITASREDFLSLEVEMGEFYLSELISKIKLYYTENIFLEREICHFQNITGYSATGLVLYPSHSYSGSRTFIHNKNASPDLHRFWHFYYRFSESFFIILQMLLLFRRCCLHQVRIS